MQGHFLPIHGDAGYCSVGTVCLDCNNSGVENKDTQDEGETMFIVVYNQHDKR